MTSRTVVGAVHVAFATTGFVAVIAAIVLLTISLAGVLPGHGPRVGFLVVGLAGLLMLAASLLLLPEVVGLTERVCLAGILGWAFVVSASVRRVGTGSRP